MFLVPELRAPPPPLLLFFPGGGRTKAKSTEIVCSRSLDLWASSMAARASSRVAYSMRA
jgi:hypothetical protein